MSLEVASDLKCRSIAFPAISCGIYGFPPKLAAQVVKRAIEAFQAGPTALKWIELVFVEPDLLAITEHAWMD
jgi:O-acetyl-ADP-ribose deacetylase (regulator of RNase III)